MRKNLLASAAVVGAMFYVGAASAQMVTSPALISGASAPNGSSAFPEPGSVTVRLAGAFDWYAAAVSDSVDRNTAQGPGGVGPAPAAYKKAKYTFGDYLRMYPTVDGVAANGLRYGFYGELRVEQPLNTGGGQFSSVSATDRASTLYVRRAYGYVGLANAGYLRFGTGDGAGGLFETGTFENFDQGGLNGDIPNFFGIGFDFPFQGGVGAFYATDKITYLSPQLYGFEVGVSYEPSTANITDYDGSTAFGSIRLSGSSAAADLKRRRNVINPEVRYRNTFGPVGVALQAGYYKSAAVGYEGTTPGTVKYKGWDFGDFGATLTFGGLSVGGHVMEGAFNGQGNLAPQGQRNSFAYIAGLSYTVGPVIVGAHWMQYNSPGVKGSSLALSSIGDRRSRGAAAGGTYTITPGVSLFLSYVYEDQVQNGYDQLNGAISVGKSTQGNVVHGQEIGTGIQIRW